jgi:hypothetical protein
MTEQELKHIFRQPYSFSNWKPLYEQIFPKVEFFIQPVKLVENSNLTVDFLHRGNVILTDNKKLAILEAKVVKNKNITKNRVELRNITVDYIDQYKHHGILIVYYSEDVNQKDYRFSFITRYFEYTSEGDLIKNQTHPKRFTYVLGENESCTTAAKRFMVLSDKRKMLKLELKDTIEAFSVETLTKEFYKKYYFFFLNFCHYIVKTNYSKTIFSLPTLEELFETTRCVELNKQQKELVLQAENKPIRDFVKRLLGRIVFLHFLQKKGWLDCPANRKDWVGGDTNFMSHLYKNYPDKTHYHSKCLTELFFKTLNEDRSNKNDIFSVTGKRVPYLNGGLFEKDLQGTEQIDFPPDFFSELFDFFEQYNFTIDENSPDEHEVGIDPEMLGHIFENLLEENKDKGAFYTPKEIVQYMCQESLIQYLSENLSASAANLSVSTGPDRVSPVEISNFIRTQQFSGSLMKKENAVKLNELLDNIKICDPAIGSGAFPIGLLQEIYKAKSHIYPFLKTSKSFNPADVKKRIIEHSIYGVDIDKGAVDIARLRFWLALVVDEEIPQPLPNLDYKIMQGNSLLERFENIDLSYFAKDEEVNYGIEDAQLDLFTNNPKNSQTNFNFIKNEKPKIDNLLHNYFKTSNRVEKADLHYQIDISILKNIKFNLHLHSENLHKQLIEQRKNLHNKLENLKSTIQIEKFLIKNTEYKKIVETENEIETLDIKFKQLINKQKTNERPYFLWHLFFKEVFDNGGFDIIIGNPPYIKEYTNKNAFDEFRNSEYYQGKMDLWYGFSCTMIDNLKENGLLCFIAQNNWTTSSGASILRNKILKETEIKIFTDFNNYKVFETAGIQTMVFLLQKKSPENKYGIKYSVLQKDDISKNQLINFLNFNTSNSFEQKFIYGMVSGNFYDKTITFNESKKDFILNKIQFCQNFTLDEKTEIAQGIVPNPDVVSSSGIIKIAIEIAKKYLIKQGDGVFVTEKDYLNNINEYEKQLIKPLYEPNQVEKYFLNKNYTKEIIYITKNEKEIDIPNIIKHLSKFKEIMEDRRENKLGRINYYQLHWGRDEKFFKEGEKILSVRKCATPTFVYTELPAYVMMSFNIIKSNQINLKYLVALLNSKLIEFWLKNKGKMQGNNFQLDKEPILNIPIYKPNITTQKPFITLVDTILSKKQTGEATAAEEAEIDRLVYELYGLSAEEIAVIEGKDVK